MKDKFMKKKQQENKALFTTCIMDATLTDIAIEGDSATDIRPITIYAVFDSATKSIVEIYFRRMNNEYLARGKHQS